MRVSLTVQIRVSIGRATRSETPLSWTGRPQRRCSGCSRRSPRGCRRRRLRWLATRTRLHNNQIAPIVTRPARPAAPDPALYQGGSMLGPVAVLMGTLLTVAIVVVSAAVGVLPRNAGGHVNLPLRRASGSTFPTTQICSPPRRTFQFVRPTSMWCWKGAWRWAANRWPPSS
jgi:hypothetical protein